MSAGAALRAEVEDRGATARIGQLFLVGSTCFAIGAVLGATEATKAGGAAILFVGSIFFTSAAAEQLRTSESDRLDITSAAIQLAGTIMFNLTTFAALDRRLDTVNLDLLVWVPNAAGSVCFLVCSVLARIAVRSAARRTKLIAGLNLLGSVAFAVSAVVSFVPTSTDAPLNFTLASWSTCAGAVCFGAAAWLLIPRDGRRRVRSP